jgi:tetraacyldisaccharide 4'-kinase
LTAVNPLNLLYATVARRRRRRYERRADLVRRLTKPVVSIGNLSVGGAGKTPLAAHVARLLSDAGERPSILSRGYARQYPEDGVTVVSDGVRLLADVARAGDEPFLLARQLPHVPVLVSADRYLAGRLAECHLGATVHVLDDGFQHFQLHRTVDLLIVEPDDLRHPRTLPFGGLREPIDAARTADAVILSAGLEPIEIADALDDLPRFTLIRDVEPAIEVGGGNAEPPAPGTKVLALCGIARPARFVTEVTAAGYVVADSMAFRDHHPYTAEDVRRVAARAHDAGVDVVLVTEKDLVRLLPLRPWPFRMAVRPLTVRVEPAATFAGWLLSRLGAAASAAGDAA